jgi:uncharacterized protein (TIGR01777 family)
MASLRRIAITGSGGFVGTALVQALRATGFTVLRLVRTAANDPDAVLWDPASGAIDVARLGEIDAVVHLAGESVAAGRWTAARKRAIQGSRGPATAALSRSLAALPHRPAVLVSASAVGIYGDRGDELLDEASRPGRGFLADVAQEWERATEPATAAGIRVVNLRIGLVLDPAGGALQRLLLPFRLGLGGKLAGGRHWMSWISRRDLVRVIRLAVANPTLRGPVVATSPHPVTNRDFTRALGRVLRRPTRLPVPRFALRLLLGEMADAMLLASQRACPTRLGVTGFVFDQPELEGALRAMLVREPLRVPAAAGNSDESITSGAPLHDPRINMTRPSGLAAAAMALAVATPAQNAAPEVRELAAALNGFAAALHGRLIDAGTPSSSPASIALALAMLLPGARGSTADELATVLRLPAELRGERLQAAADSLLRHLGVDDRTPGDRHCQLRITNDLWTQSGHPIEPAYAKTLREAFHAGHHDVAFRDDPDGARRRINAHVARATNDRIRDLLSPDLVTADTRTILTNALWLKAKWADEFYEGATKPAPFHLRKGQTVDVPMMRNVDSFAYAETADWQCVVLPFAGHTLACEVMLPRKGKDLAAAEQALLAGAHQQGIAPNRVDVHLPRFRVASTCRLRDPLQTLGLRAAFVPSTADFTGISPKGQLVLDDVVHQTWIQVDEHGAEAAAATASVMTVGSAMPPKQQPPIPFVADRPFAFALRHRTSNLVLFVGRVEDPRGASTPGR